MKKYCQIAFLFVVAASVFLSCREEPKHIHGDIVNLPDGAVYLRVWEGALRTVDSTRSDGGRFSFLLPDVLPDIFYVQFEGYPNYFIPWIVDGDEVGLGGDFNYPDDIKVSGTAPNDALWGYRESVRRYEVMLRAINRQLELYRSEEMDSVAYRGLLVKEDSLKRIMSGLRRDFVRSHRGSIVSAFLVVSSLSDSSTRAQIDSLIGELDPTMADNAFLRRLHRRRNAAVQ